MQAGRYLGAVLLRTDKEEKAVAIWQMMDALIFPAQTYDKKTAFVTAIGRILWGDL